MASNELARQVAGQAPVNRADKATVKAAQAYQNDVRLRGFVADGATALAAHLMEGLHDLDLRRKAYSGDDPNLQMVMDDIFARAVYQAACIQRGLMEPNDGFGL